MRPLAVALILLVIAIQYPLWFGKGGWLRVRHVEQQLQAQRTTNADLARRNAVLNAEVVDLKNGLDAIEERARSELGMIKSDEIFFQVLDARPVTSKADR